MPLSSESLLSLVLVNCNPQYVHQVGIDQEGKKALSRFMTNMAEILTAAANRDFPMSLDKVVRVTVPRPQRSRSKREKEEEEEVLVIDEIEVRKDMFVKFDVLINNEEDDEDEAACRAHKTEFAGSFVNVPCKRADENNNGEMIKMKQTRLRLGIGELLKDLGAENDEDAVVTLVPRCECGSVTIGGIKIELEA